MGAGLAALLAINGQSGDCFPAGALLARVWAGLWPLWRWSRLAWTLLRRVWAPWGAAWSSCLLYPGFAAGYCGGLQFLIIHSAFAVTVLNIVLIKL
jgi:hypothetical protein